MPLAGSLVGDGTIVSREKTPPIVILQIGVISWSLEITTERREWYALTETAAKTAVDANVQPTPPTDETYTWTMEQTDLVIRAFKVIRSSELREYSTS